jgi:hypothetical protein
MLTPLNTALNPRQRALMRLEYRLINELGADRYAGLQPLVRQLADVAFQPGDN